MEREAKPLGAVLAGGAATRLGGSKATVELVGRPLIAYPLAAFADARIEAVVVAKPDTELPPLDVEVVTEPTEPRHPLLGLVTALTHAEDRPVIACPCDTPFVTPVLITRLATAAATAVVHDGKRLHPLLARYQPSDLSALRDALEAQQPATKVAESLSPVLIEAAAELTFNVNTPHDLAAAQARLG